MRGAGAETSLPTAPRGNVVIEPNGPHAVGSVISAPLSLCTCNASALSWQVRQHLVRFVSSEYAKREHA